MDIRIDRCLLRGLEGDVRRAHRVLMNCPWPPAGEAEVLILRRIDVRARSERLPARLYQAADALMAGSIDGWSEAAAGADCVRFRSEADMLARLSLDLAAGRAGDLWFWQSFRRYWSAAPGRALAELWLDEASRLPAITAILRGRRALPPVWRQLSAPAARTLLSRIMGPDAAAELQKAPTPAAPAALWERLPAATPAAKAPSPDAAKLIAALQDFEINLETGDQAPNAKDDLALVLAVAEAHPHWLAAPDAGPRLLALRTAVAHHAGLGRRRRSERTSRRAGGSLTVPPAPPQDRAPPAGINESAPTGGVETRDERQASDQFRSTPGDAEGRGDGERQVPAETAPAAAEAPVVSDAAVDLDPTPAHDHDTWHIAQGGLFYLLNLLNWRPVRERLFADPEAMAFPSGWGWLYRLGEHLALEPEPPLIHCLAHLAGLTPKRFPADLPPLQAAADIAALGAERYARFGIWHPRLLQMPALVRHRRPELDIHYAMADLYIAVRSAALDVDPGWVDWLGTVVRFHYR